MFSFLPGKTATALSVGDRCLAWLTLVAGKDGPAVRALGTAYPATPLPPLREPERRHVAITETARPALGNSKLAEAAVVLRQRDAKAHFAWLPTVVPAEIEQMARFEMQKIAPLDADRYIPGHTVLSRNGGDGAFGAGV